MEKELAFILAGGKGKRMGVLCHRRAKPLLTFAGNHRVIDFSLSNCVNSRIKSVIVLSDYERTSMENYLTQWCSRNISNGGIDILTPRNCSYLGTADAIFQNLDVLRQSDVDTVLVLSADHVYQTDYRELLSFHEHSRADATISVVPVPVADAYRFGILVADKAGKITEFEEKPEIPVGNLASMGIYAFKKELLIRYLIENAVDIHSLHDFGHTIIPKMIRQDSVFAYRFDGYWKDIGTIVSFYETNMEILQGQSSFSLNDNWPIYNTDGQRIQLLPYQHECNNIKNSIVSPDCIIKGRVENSILSPGVMVEEKAVIKNSVVMANTYIGYHSLVDHSVVDEDVTIDKFCYVGFKTSVPTDNVGITVLGKGVSVTSYTAIARNCEIPPFYKLEDSSYNIIMPDNLVSSYS